MSFDHESLWVQLHDLPLACMNRDYGERIRGTIGKVVEVDVPKDGIYWGQYLRVKIETSLLNVNKIKI